MKLNGLIILGAALVLAPLSAEATVSKASLSVAPKAKKDSVAIMKEKAEKGDAVAQNQMGVWYYVSETRLQGGT